MDIIRETLNKIRKAINEGAKEGKAEDTHPYSRQDPLLSSIIETTKAQFGADYTDIKTPMFYSNGEVKLNGNIPDLNGAKFQFKYPSSTGCFLWIGKGMTLTPENITKLSRIYGVYKNWKTELATTEDIRPMDLKNGD